MMEFWLISAPGTPSCQHTFDTLNEATSKENLSRNYKFQLPDLKVGTLDQLVSLSDELVRVDQFAEQVTRKFASYIGDVLEAQRNTLHEHLQVAGTDMATYVTRFQWNLARYSNQTPLRELTARINKELGFIDAQLKIRSADYNTLRANIQAYERKQSGSLIGRNLADLVSREHFVEGSEYLVTLLVVVPRNNYNTWNEKYETLTDMVVPQSTNLIMEDADHGLYTVTLFKKVVDEFKNQARALRFVVREFEYDEKSIQSGKDERERMELKITQQRTGLVDWLKTNFGETFMAWVHVKAIMIFVESVLRYGLPINFQAMVLQPNKKCRKRLRRVLNVLYAHLDNTAGGVLEDIPGLNLGPSEYYSYVNFKIVADMADPKTL